jgi:hypothetical protein
MQHDLGISDQETGRVTSAETRFAQKCYLCARKESLSIFVRTKSGPTI